MIKRIGTVTSDQQLSIYHHADPASLLYRNRRSELQKFWSSTSYHMQRIRNNPDCADTEYETIEDDSDPGLSYNITFDPAEPLHGRGFLNSAPSLASKFFQSLSLKQKPRVAILREQGVNGAKEMAYAFIKAGFLAEDVHMTDLIHGRKSLSSFVGLAACGGFSYGDVLGAGRGCEYSFAFISSCGILKPLRRVTEEYMARSRVLLTTSDAANLHRCLLTMRFTAGALSVALNRKLGQEFNAFFERPDTFTLGVCNGCQFLTQLAQVGIIPNTTGWPVFQRNESDSFEARFSMVEVLDNPSAPSVFLHGMKGSKLPIAVSHGEGRTSFPNRQDQNLAAQDLLEKEMVSLRYLDNRLEPTEAYPANPNGSPLGIAGLTSNDGRYVFFSRCYFPPPPPSGSWERARLTAPVHIKGARHDAAPRAPGDGRRWIVDSRGQSRGVERGAVGHVVQECAEVGGMRLMDGFNVADGISVRRYNLRRR